MTARSGGILYPILDSVSRSFGSEPNKPSATKIGQFLVLTSFQGTCITSAMFLTSMAATATALGGLVVLLLTEVLDWKDVQTEKGAWETLIWFSVLITLASQLNKMGVTIWFGDLTASNVSDFEWQTAFAILSLTHFFSHYFFASNLAHVGAMFAIFLVVAIKLGSPPALVFYTLSFIE